MPTPEPTGTILVVDDDKGVCDVMAMTIQGSGYEAVKAASGEEAIEIVKSRGADLVLVVLDMTMDGLGGPGTWLAVHALHTELPFVLVSGDQMDSVRAALESAAIRADDPTIKGFLKKPFLPCDLQDAVRQALGV